MSTDIFLFWAQIEATELIHPADKNVLSRAEHKFDLRCLPGAFFGPLRTAPVVLLYLSPGWHKSDVDEASTHEAQRRYVEYRRGFAPLPSPDEHYEGWKWWSTRTKVFGRWEDLLDKIAVLNIGAYHSKTFEGYELLASLPSCRVSLDWAQTTLFPEALDGHRIVVCLRAARFWGLAQNKTFGKSLYAPSVTRGGNMTHSPLRDEIIKNVRERLNS